MQLGLVPNAFGVLLSAVEFGCCSCIEDLHVNSLSIRRLRRLLSRSNTMVLARTAALGQQPDEVSACGEDFVQHSDVVKRSV